LTEVVVAGSATTRFGRHPDADIVDLAAFAALSALDDAGVTPEQVDALELGTFLGRSLQRRGVLASLVASRVGLRSVPTTVVEGACASGGIALRHGVLACLAGAARTVLCVGAEHMTAVPTSGVTTALAEAFEASDQSLGLTFPGFFGLVAAAHGARDGTARRHLTAVAVKNRAHGATNPNAMFAEPVAADAVDGSRLIADPLRLFDCSPIADGAAAAVVMVADDASQPRRAARVLACEQASGRWASRRSTTSRRSARPGRRLPLRIAAPI
jgi:acetyl-CoA C-acetyltransferase